MTRKLRLSVTLAVAEWYEILRALADVRAALTQEQQDAFAPMLAEVAHEAQEIVFMEKTQE